MGSAPVAFEVFLFDRGRFVGSRIFAGPRQVSIGRSQDSTLRLEDPLVSGRHAILFVKDGRLHIADEGSSNGLFVNGKRVEVEAIGPLDEIRLGESRIKIEIIGDEAAEMVPAPERTVAGLELTAGPSSEPPRRTPGPAQVPPAPAPRPFAPAPTQDLPDEAVDPSLWADVAPEPASPPREVPAASRPASQPAASAAAAPATTPASIPAASPGPKPAPASARAGTPTPPPRPTKAGRSKETKEAVPQAKAQPPLQAPIPEAEPPKAARPPAAPPKARRPEGPADAARPATPESPGAPGIAELLEEAKAELATPEEEAPSAGAARPAPPLDDSEEVLPYPPAPPEVDEEAEEERNFVPPFSLLESLVLDSGDAGSIGLPVVEVLRYRGDRLLDAARVDPGESYEILRGEDARDWRMLQLLRKGKLRLFFLAEDVGNLIIGGHRTTLAALADESHLVDKKRKIYAVDLAEGDRAQLWIDGAGFYVRPVRAPRPPPKDFSFKISKEDRLYALAGVGGIVLMLGGIWIQALISPPELIVMEEVAQFAEISLKDLEMERPPEPPPPPPPDPEPPAEVSAPAPEPTPAPAPRPQPRRQPRARAAAGNPSAQPAAAPPPSAADEALAALAGIAPSGEANLSAAVSNIAAVRAPAGTSSTFAVSGAIGKVPGDEVSLSRGGKAGGAPAGRETRAAAAVLAGTNVGQVGGGGGTGRVRAVVTSPPARSVGTAGGSLSRDAIFKVVSAATSRVQSCYERELIRDPGLQGKITFEWVISPEGSVSSSKVSQSSLPSQAVATCISGVIRSLQFPKPSGGSVSVTYPFTFASQGF